VSYAAVEAGALRVLRKLTEFDTGNSALNDFRILQQAKSYYVVIIRGTGNRAEIQQTDVQANGSLGRRHLRRITIRVFVPYTVDALVARTSLNSIVQTTLDKFDQYPHLDQTAGVMGTDADSLPRPEEYTYEDKRFFEQEIQLNVEFEERVTVLE
jgi:hypothetical protein